MHIETFNISFESTHNKQQYGTKITRTEVRKKVMVIGNTIKLLGDFQVLTFIPPTLHYVLGGGIKGLVKSPVAPEEIIIYRGAERIFRRRFRLRNEALRD